LKARRDKLPEQAGVFYRHIAGRVDAYATDRPDRVEIVGAKDGSVEVTITEAAEGATPYYHRTLLPAETSEVRIHLGAADARVAGEAGGRPGARRARSPAVASGMPGAKRWRTPGG